MMSDDNQDGDYNSDYSEYDYQEGKLEILDYHQRQLI